MKEFFEEFKMTIEESSSRLLKITEAESENRSSAEKWSKKEILGHLIDSASNNHQRFVRAQLANDLSLPGYEQNLWVKTQQYQKEPWQALVQFWKSYNLHLLNVISSVPDDRLTNRLRVGNGEPVSLEFLIRDYLVHLKHHVTQIVE